MALNPKYGSATCPQTLVIIACLLAVAGCSSGGGSDDPAATPPPDDPLVATLDSIQEHVFTPRCTDCHAGASAPEGLRLEEGLSHGMLVNVDSAQVPALKRVEPGNPDDSYLIHKLEGTASVGGRMPLGGPFLSQETIDVIRQWITEGAQASVAKFTRAPAMITGAWPVAGAVLSGPPAHIVLIANMELDTTLLHPGSVRVIRLDDIEPATLQPRQMANVQLYITSLEPTVIRLSIPAADWTPGRYEIRILGTGGAPVADRSGRLIDGNADGVPGGDFVLHFEIEPAQ